VLHEGNIVERGSFYQLMSVNGFLAALYGEHKQLFNISSNDFPTSKHDSELLLPKSLVKSFENQWHLQLPLKQHSENDLAYKQMLNRSCVAANNNIVANEHNLAKYIETRSRLPENLEESVCKNELAQYTSNQQSESGSEFRQPMKLVLEDQSIYYKVPAIWAYLKSGYGITVSLVILSYFLGVHVFRVLSGKSIKIKKRICIGNKYKHFKLIFYLIYQ
jgi:hypothetical protein